MAIQGKKQPSLVVPVMPMDIKRHVKTFRRPQGNSAVEDWCVESLSGRMFGLDVCVRRALTVNSQMEHTKCMRSIQECLTITLKSLKVSTDGNMSTSVEAIESFYHLVYLTVTRWRSAHPMHLCNYIISLKMTYSLLPFLFLVTWQFSDGYKQYISYYVG